MNDAILLVDDNATILEIMSLYVESFGDNVILIAKSGNEAIDILKSNEKISLVISDFNMPDGTGGDLYKFVKSNFPDLPFTLQSAEPLEFLDEFIGFPHSTKENYLQKPFSIDQVHGVLEAVFSTDVASDNKYVRVLISTLKKYSKTGVDAFIKLSEKKFVKLHHFDDELDEESLDKYLAKGIEYFHILEDDFKIFIKSCQDELDQKLTSPNLDAAQLAQVKFNSTDNLLEGMQAIGISEFTLEQAEKITDSIVSNIPKKSDIAALIKQMQSGETYISRLSLLTGNMAVALAENVSWSNRGTYEKLMTAALFMDAAWLSQKPAEDNPELLEITYNDSKELGQCPPLIQEVVLNHSHSSAELFDTVKSDGDIYNLIVDHHERPEGRGFPKQVHSSQISSLAAILIFAHEFSHRLIGCGEFNIAAFTEVKQDMIKEFSTGNFKDPCQSFIKICS